MSPAGATPDSATTMAASPTMPWNRRVAPSSSAKSLVKVKRTFAVAGEAQVLGADADFHLAAGLHGIAAPASKAMRPPPTSTSPGAVTRPGHQVHGRRADEGGDEARCREAVDVVGRAGLLHAALRS